jgi:hypothetical protein
MSSCITNTGKKQGCESGAIGAVVGELAAQWYDPNGTKPPQDTLNFVKVVSAAAGAITGDGSAESVSTASMTGVNAVSYPSVRDTFGVEFQPLFFQRSASRGWSLIGLRHFFDCAVPAFCTKAATRAGIAPAPCGQCCWR